ncbi:hypothetical protein CR201_G0055636 [Pongo abelii]|uniref:Uncharacterized protein n=1 Tax=Pongo abelii TaxID=9601 RepID=A0A2J8QZG2_PONAB|nr:hypothetical protein CR201_G0055636 [Pongo abelii]
MFPVSSGCFQELQETNKSLLSSLPRIIRLGMVLSRVPLKWCVFSLPLGWCPLKMWLCTSPGRSGRTWMMFRGPSTGT